MKVCHVFPTVLLHDGPTNVLLGLLGQLGNRGVANTVISLRRPPLDRNASEKITALGARYIQLEMKQGLWDPSILSTLSKTIRAEQPDIVQCNLFRANVYGTIATRMSGVARSICVAHNIESYMTGSKPQDRIARALERTTSRWTAGYVAVSEAVASAVRDHIGIQKIRVISNGLEVGTNALPRILARQRLNIPPSAFVIGSVGRLHAQKGYADLLGSAARLSGMIPDLHITIIGEGEERDTLQRLCNQQSLGEFVSLIGARTDVPEVLSAFDIFAMTSYYEGLPIALLEAMRCGIPAVVTNAGGMGEAVEDGITGYVVPPGDSSAFIEKVMRLAQDSQLRESMGRAAQARFSAIFTASVMSDSYLQMYEQVTNTGQSDKTLT